MSKFTYPELDQCQTRYVAVCPKCGEKGYKKDMVMLLTKTSSYKPVQKLCHVCNRCITHLLDDLGVSMPD